MAQCPGCSARIKVYQMSPYCKKCGVHLMFASFEGQFQKDRRIAEMSMAFFRYNMVKLKSAYTSGKAQKFKIVAAFFPLIALLIPSGSLSLVTPVYSSHISFNVIDLFITPFFMNGLFGKLDALSVGPVFGEVASSLKVLMIVYALTAVSAIIILLLELFSFIGNKKVQVMTMIFSVVGVAGSVLLKVFTSSLISAAAGTGNIVNVESGLLFIVNALLFVVPFVSALICLKNPPVYKFRDGDELRVEYRRKYKKGVIDLMDIPAPIYESEEDKAERNRLVCEAYNMTEDTQGVTADG